MGSHREFTIKLTESEHKELLKAIDERRSFLADNTHRHRLNGDPQYDQEKMLDALKTMRAKFIYHD